MARVRVFASGERARLVPDHVIEYEGYSKPGAGHLSNAYYRGEKILAGRREIHHASCRHLKAIGLTGGIAFVDKTTGEVRSVIRDLVKGAGKTIRETATVGPVIAKWRPLDREAAFGGDE